MFFSFRQKLGGTCRQENISGSSTGLGGTGHQPAALFHVDGTLYCQCSGCFIEVRPHETAELTPPQAGGQLRVEEVVPDGVVFDCLHEPFQLVIIQDLLGFGIRFWNRDVLGGIFRYDMGFLCRFHGTMEHGV